MAARPEVSAPYDMRCPIARTLDIIGERWTILILRDLVVGGPRKFHDFERSLAGISPNTLSARLKRLEDAGIVERRFYEQHPPRAEYLLTEKGNELRPVLRALLDWGRTHTKFRR
jgi:DNA-binding HxlR family transcriptional regulator